MRAFFMLATLLMVALFMQETQGEGCNKYCGSDQAICDDGNCGMCISKWCFFGRKALLLLGRPAVEAAVGKEKLEEQLAKEGKH